LFRRIADFWLYFLISERLSWSSSRRRRRRRSSSSSSKQQAAAAAHENPPHNLSVSASRLFYNMKPALVAALTALFVVGWAGSKQPFALLAPIISRRTTLHTFL
jgi:hypothetical protein